jgi:hypothetical protein
MFYQHNIKVYFGFGGNFKVFRPCVQADIEMGGVMKRVVSHVCRRPVLLIGILILAGGVLHAQQPVSFHGIGLGMDLSLVKEKLMTDPLFAYRGDPDVSLLPRSSQALIECRGTTYIQRAYFQFEKEKLFIMIFVLDEQKLDHYSLFTTLERKYGKPLSLSPQETVWLFESVRFTLERPLTVKYVERKTFETLLEKGAAQEDLEQVSREKFLEEF